MASSRAASPAFRGIPNSSTATTRASLSIPTPRFFAKTPLRGLGFVPAASADPLFSHHAATKLASFKNSGKPPRFVVSNVKKSMKQFADLNIAGKKVLLRADLDVPLDENQNITDDTKIHDVRFTISCLMRSGAKVILCSHLGRPKGVDPKLSLAPLVPTLSKFLGVQVVKADHCVGPEVEKLVDSLPDGGVLLLENVWFYEEEEKNDPDFAKKLASLADLYVNDAFCTAHKAHASTVGVTKFLKPSVTGFVLEEELKYLVGVVSFPRRPFAAIIGGSKVSSKIEVIESLLEKCDILLLGGAMIFTFYKAQGLSVGSSLVEEDKIDRATSLLQKAEAKGVNLLLPTDVIIADKFAPDAKSKVVPASAIPDGWMGLDIGPDSVRRFNDALETTKTIFWHGPMGVFEFDNFAGGTLEIAKKVGDRGEKDATTIVGGGGALAALWKLELVGMIKHRSGGGDATLELLAGKKLPGIDALDRDTPIPLYTL